SRGRSRPGAVSIGSASSCPQPCRPPAAPRAHITWSFRCRMTCQPDADRLRASLTGEGVFPMALIKPRSRGKRLVRHRTRLDHTTNETLYAYALFIGEPTEYVLNQVIDTVLGRDKEFLQWRVTHPDSCVPNSAASDRRRRRV